jgi:WD40 repeat protein
MGKLRHGFLIALDRGLTMMHRAIGVPLWHTVQMDQGTECKIDAFLVANHYPSIFVLKHVFIFVRLFSCGTSKEGESHLVEWNESEGAIKRTYSGFRKRSLGVVQFDTTRNRYLAAGDEFMVKFWDMDNTNILTTTDADGGLPVSSHQKICCSCVICISLT